MSIPEESSETILERENKKQREAIAILKEVMEFADAKTRKNLANKLGAKLRSTETYYSAKAASGIKKIVDEMMIDGKDREILFQDYPQYAPSTIRQKINSALSYIVDEMDDEDCKYAEWRKLVRVCVKKDKSGVLFRYVCKERRSIDIEFKAHVLDHKETPIEENEDDKFNALVEEQNWKHQLIEFVQNDEPTSQFKKSNLTLTEEDKSFIKELCVNPPYVVRVSNERITILNDPNNSLNLPSEERIIIK